LTGDLVYGLSLLFVTPMYYSSYMYILFSKPVQTSEQLITLRSYKRWVPILYQMKNV